MDGSIANLLSGLWRRLEDIWGLQIDSTSWAILAKMRLKFSSLILGPGAERLNTGSRHAMFILASILVVCMFAMCYIFHNVSCQVDYDPSYLLAQVAFYSALPTHLGMHLVSHASSTFFSAPQVDLL